MDLTDDELAFHESGHALLSYVEFGSNLTAVDIVGNAERLGQAVYPRRVWETLAAAETNANSADRWSRWTGRCALVSHARVAAAGVVAEGMRRLDALWWPPGAMAEVAEGGDGATIHQAFCALNRGPGYPYSYELRLRREVERWTRERRRVLRDCAVLLLRERAVPGKVFLEVAHAAATRHGVALSPLRPWWPPPKR